MPEAWHAEARLLSDESSAMSAWVGAAIAMVAMVATAVAIGIAGVLWQRRTQKQSVQCVDSDRKKAWPDPEVGGKHSDVGATPDKMSTPQTGHSGEGMSGSCVPDKLAANVRLELAELLRGVLEDEISRGLKASGISERLDRLEQQQKEHKEHQVLSGALLPPPCLPPGMIGHGAESAKRPSWQSRSAKQDAETLTDQSMQLDASTLTDEQGSSQPALNRRDSGMCPWTNDLSLSPSARQNRYQDPPETAWTHIDEDNSLRLSLQTVQRNLYRRDSQTQELHKQLRATQQDCIRQRQDACHANSKLQDLLSNPASAPQAQALELQGMRRTVDDLSELLGDSRSKVTQLSIVTQRQRAYFMQNEHLQAEGANILKRHPAGEVFLAPPPVYLGDDMNDDPRKPPWDIGTSHINPYAIDSWPFEPNVLSQKCAVEPNLGRWDEEDGIATDSEESLTPHSSSRSAEFENDEEHRMRLPNLPPESPLSPDHDHDFAPPEPADPPEPLPPFDGRPTSSRSY